MSSNLLELAKEVVFPSYCLLCENIGSVVCKNCLKKIPVCSGRCIKCSRKNPGSNLCHTCRGKFEPDRVFSLFSFQSRAKKLIHQFKYEDVTDVAEIFGQELARLIKDVPDYNKYFLVPVPISDFKKRYRGYNQSHLLSQAVASSLHLEIKDCLVKSSKDEDLVGHSKKERLELIKNSFKAVGEVPERVILIDDVITSGATIREATKVLKKAGAKQVIAVSIAM